MVNNNPNEDAINNLLLKERNVHCIHIYSICSNSFQRIFLDDAYVRNSIQIVTFMQENKIEMKYSQAWEVKEYVQLILTAESI